MIIVAKNTWCESVVVVVIVVVNVHDIKKLPVNWRKQFSLFFFSTVIFSDMSFYLLWKWLLPHKQLRKIKYSANRIDTLSTDVLAYICNFLLLDKNVIDLFICCKRIKSSQVIAKVDLKGVYMRKAIVLNIKHYPSFGSVSDVGTY
jgi:hypothetical protein